MIVTKVGKGYDWWPHFVTAIVYSQDGIVVVCCALVGFGYSVLFGRFGGFAVDVQRVGQGEQGFEFPPTVGRPS